uniref:FAD_binding_2 domain-containing protein n=1 Tax=Rhabditophanes sp. KR3021 TaxID=114890 RepID=A0AC35UHR6_9BILA
MTTCRSPKETDPVIIVGGGLAGLSAALEIISSPKANTKVVIFEKEKSFGGNSIKASSGINACGTEIQKLNSIKDSVDLFIADTLKGGDNENDHALVDFLARNSVDSLKFLMDNGVFIDDVNLCGGHSVPRTHWAHLKDGKPIPIGLSIINALKGKINEISEKNPGLVEIHLNAEVLGLTTWNEYITGIRYKDVENATEVKEYTGKAVILTTGGFSADKNSENSLLNEFGDSKLLKDLPTTNGAFADGSGIKMARAMGAELIGMENIQIHPTTFIDPNDKDAMTKFLAAEALRGKGAILLTEKGKRFANELGRRDYLSDKIFEECQITKDNKNIAFMLLNDDSVQGFGSTAFAFYWKVKKFFKQVNSLAELSSVLGCDQETLQNTLLSYNKAADQGKDEFGKTVFPTKFDVKKPFYVAKITPGIHYSMGGLKINSHGKVFNSDNQAYFNGLYAAGEITGGVHGKNRLAGNSLLECVVFGRSSGKSASTLKYGHQEL